MASQEGKAVVAADIEAQITKWEAQYGDVVTARTPRGTVVLRPPESHEHQRFVELLMDDKKRNNVSHMKQFVCSCRLAPDPDGFLAILARYPALVQSLSDALHKVAGGEIEVVAGKP